MRRIKINQWIIVLSLFSFLFYSCSDSPSETEDPIIPEEAEGKYAGFDFKTVQEYQVSVTTSNVGNEALGEVYLEMYTNNPLDTAGVLIPDHLKIRCYKGLSNANGVIECKVNPAASVDSLFVLTYHVGLPRLTSTFLSGEIINIAIGGSEQTSSATQSVAKMGVKVDNIPDVDDDNGYYILGDWGKKGLPEYLEDTDDEITNEFLEKVNASLPEGKTLMESHPEYLANGDDTNIEMIDEGEIWVTFVHEGAGWKNALGYYTYPTGSAPQSIDDIEDMTIIYPNVSMGNKDELESGNKVQLLYLNQDEEEYSKLFPAGVTVGWFLVAHGWQDGKREVDEGKYTHFSNIYLNEEGDTELQKHTVVLYDEDTERFVMGFEDIPRNSSSCDHDFNDAVFYATFNPITAVKTDDYQIVDDESDDADDDGIRDEYDEYPEDGTKAFNNYYVAEGEFGTLAFEDLWPSKGDFDFNDLVVAYNFNQITNADNDIVEIDAKLKVKAIGASKKNAFGFSLETASSNISSVSGQNITEGFLSIASNGTENGQSKAVIICFDNAFNVTSHPGGGSGVNTTLSAPYSTPGMVELSISFTNPVNYDDLGTPPYNPFIIINQERGKEVHLPNNKPTDLADVSLFGEKDDDTNADMGEYYVSDKFLPWAINLPVSFDYPAEKKSILDCYLKFDAWASSNGVNNEDWYMNETGYRNAGNIYSK